MADYVPKRQNLANAAVQASTAFTDSLYALQNLIDQYKKLPAPFLDSDFTGTSLVHLDAGTVGTLFDFVIPAFITTYNDAANGERNKQILMQVRR
jgi:hypothetical protein